MAWSKGQHVPRPGQPAAHRRRRQPRSMPQPLPARGDPNPDHLFVADGGGQCPGRAGGRTRKKEGPMGRLNQLPSSHSPRGERKLPSRAPLPAAVPVSVLALALTAVTTLVVTGATRAPDARALAAGTALDTPGLAHLVARCIALGGQFGLVGTGLILTAAAVAWHRRVWRPLLVPLAALAALNAATARPEARHRAHGAPRGHRPGLRGRLVLSFRARRERHRLPAPPRGRGLPQRPARRRPTRVVAAGAGDGGHGGRGRRGRTGDGRAGLPLGQRRGRRMAARPGRSPARPAGAPAASSRRGAHPGVRATSDSGPDRAPARPAVTVAAAGPGCAARASWPAALRRGLLHWSSASRPSGPWAAWTGLAPAQCRSRSTQTSTVAAGEAASTSECPATVT